jgi:hypothetical protein
MRFSAVRQQGRDLAGYADREVSGVLTSRGAIARGTRVTSAAKLDRVLPDPGGGSGRFGHALPVTPHQAVLSGPVRNRISVVAQMTGAAFEPIVNLGLPISRERNGRSILYRALAID